ncbi:probable E3 ubiquitin-protein ligase makorin-1 isoform X1 [Sinocyclocheilus grahami]|uniref:probable E3 ubiquitin-protein ligase makorin-1 isoform X1 n=1 Tax=Sinocyclocheilus grahami TaxID=75366 RepID=UPI0007AD37C2|nr:PREDICTED: probable E3 ubiquitin-protein ligase makorin-1 isoform X1 [Sinocyclocheilus grahami]
MEREAQSSKGPGNNSAACRQFINGSCRYGPSCYYLHEFPAVPSFQVQCRYFQKGGCWFGDRCRYLHVPQAGEGSSGSSRRGSAPAGFFSVLAGRSLADRRGSEPSLLPPQGARSMNRRGSEPLVTGMSVLQQNFECLTTGIAEEEEFGVVEDGPPQQGAMRPLQQISATDSSSSHNYSSSAFVPAEVQYVTVSEAETQVTGSPERPNQSGAAVLTEQQHSRALDQSKDVACGICMDKISEKSTTPERRYGILPNCNHAFCISCIVTWRKTKDFQEDVIKGCPQCRVKSSFYIPSKHWVCDGEEKASLIAAFKERSSKLKCTFFMRHGCCPFKSECIYSHDMPPNHTHRRRRSASRDTAEMLEDLGMECIYSHDMPPNHTHRRRRSASRDTAEMLEDLGIDGIQLWSYIFALTLLDEDDEDLLDFLDD